ncbi:MAG: hypothetical protein HY529_02130 [Chloroflexi bacterium]|nr:hypothetical protein [Chloroflexota bacterium]
MKLSIFMAIGAVLALVFGLAFILVPTQTMLLYGITLEAGGQWLGRYLGSAFIGIAVLTWRARKAPQGDALSAVILGDLAVSVTGLIVAVLNKISGTGNALVWSTVAIYLFLTLGYGYFQFVKPKSGGD